MPVYTEKTIVLCLAWLLVFWKANGTTAVSKQTTALSIFQIYFSLSHILILFVISFSDS
jgi:hypothetical protein